MQVYQLQTENDEEETWRDLVSGYFLCDSHSTEHVFHSLHTVLIEHYDW